MLINRPKYNIWKYSYPDFSFEYFVEELWSNTGTVTCNNTEKEWVKYSRSWKSVKKQICYFLLYISWFYSYCIHFRYIKLRIYSKVCSNLVLCTYAVVLIIILLNCIKKKRVQFIVRFHLSFFLVTIIQHSKYNWSFHPPMSSLDSLHHH